MKISTKGRYALRTLIDLAQHSGEGLVPLKDIAARQEISQKYLEQIVTQMSKAGFFTGCAWPARRLSAGQRHPGLYHGRGAASH
jgi:hypothetical protein